MYGYIKALNNIVPIASIPRTIPRPISDGECPTNILFTHSHTSTNGCIKTSYNAPAIALIPNHIPCIIPSLKAAPIPLNLVNKLAIN